MSWGMVVVGGAVVPLLVWLLRRAGAPVSPVVAVAVVVAALLVVVWRWQEGRWAEWWWPVPWVLTVVGVPLCLADVRHRRLPDVLTLSAYPVMATAMTVAAVSGGGATLLVSAAEGVLVFGGVHLVVHRVRPAQLGAGDVKLAGVLGAVLGALGWASVAVAAVAAAGLSAVVAVGAQVPAIAERARRTQRASGLPASATSPKGASRAGSHPASATSPKDAPGAHPASATQETSPPQARDGPCAHRAIRCGVPHGPALVVAAWTCAVFPGLGSGVVPS
ncbi:A24 family peptidase [Amycolatopsis sp. DSM 110486]|uniref:prepilin peptidase n=1 Tax=Amycolatopsis sp. DSM 110486 TaxID=2865832 RepID=UPI00210312AE|nr:A24 family peptidase [Amycolatopsis sp. DSM 110486]